MKKLLALCISLFAVAAFAQTPDTLTPEKNARWKIGRIRDNTVRAITPQDFRNAFKSVTDIAVTRVPYLTPGQLRAGKADTSQVIQVLDSFRSGMFRYVPTDTVSTDDSVKVIRFGSRRYLRVFDGLVNVRWYGAKGDGTTDDTQAIKVAMIKNPNGVYFPEGTYIISSPVPFYGSMQGSGNEKTIIKASASFVGAHMIDNNAGSDRKYMRDLRLDANDKTGVQHLGSSGDAQGSSTSLYENVFFYNSHKDSYSIGGSSVTPVAGMLTGATFYNCHWRGIGKALNLGINQDDIQFIGCRFGLDKNTISTPFIIGNGNNQRFQGCYFYIQDVVVSATVGKIFQVGGSVVELNNNFIESPVSTNITHLFHCASPGAKLSIRNLHLNLSGASAFVALIRTQVEAGSNDYRNIDINNVSAQNLPVTAKLLDVYVATTALKQITLTFNNVDPFASVYQIASGGSANANNILRLIGNLKGVSYNNFATSTAIKENSTNNVLLSEGLVSDFVTTTTATTLSPNSTTYTLPKWGQYLVTVSARINSSLDQMLVGRYVVDYFGTTMAYSELLGTVRASAGASFGPSTLTVSNPDSAGVITITAGWTVAGSHPVTFVINVRRINTY